MHNVWRSGLLVFLCAALLMGCDGQAPTKQWPEILGRLDPAKRMRDTTLPMAQRLSAAAMERTRHTVRYDPAYLRIPYPGGDVPAAQGVCSDEVIRAFRSLGIDLQERVHRDMVRNFGRYPKAWGLDRPDANIDHRRVPNLEVYFARHGQSLSVSSNPADYRPGDIVTWRLPGNLPHIGIVTELRSRDGQRPLIVHNIGAGPQLEDALFRYPLHRRFAYPARQS